VADEVGARNMLRQFSHTFCLFATDCVKTGIPSKAKRKPSIAEHARVHPGPCPCCGGRMLVIEVFACGCEPKVCPTPARLKMRIDTS